jgi:hypothetical protein
MFSSSSSSSLFFSFFFFFHFLCFGFCLSTWRPVGPFYHQTAQAIGIGSINAIATNSDYSSFYVGASNGGVWFSSSVFNSSAPSESPVWTPLTDENRCNSAASISVSADDSSFIGYSCAGVSSLAKLTGPLYGAYLSYSGGSHWTLAPLPFGLDLNRIHLFGTAKGNGKVLVSAKGALTKYIPVGWTTQKLSKKLGGIWYSNDSGHSFHLSLDPLVHDRAIRDTQIHKDSLKVYAVDYKGNILSSTDFGFSWMLLQSQSSLPWVGVNFRLTIGYAPGGPVIWSIACDENNHGIIQWSYNDGLLWENSTIPDEIPQYGGVFFFAIVADPQEPELFYIAGAVDSVYRGNITARSNVTSMYIPLASDGAAHADHRFLMFYPPLNLLLLACDGGIWALSNPRIADETTAVWHSLNGNLQITEFNSLAYDPVSNTIASGAQDNGIWINMVEQVANGKSFLTFPFGDGEGVDFNNQQSPSVLYFSTQYLDYEFIYRIGSSPASVTQLTPLRAESYFESIIRVNTVNSSYQLLCVNPGCIQLFYPNATNTSTVQQTELFPDLMISDYIYGGQRINPYNGKVLVKDPNVVFAIYQNTSVFASDSNGTSYYTNTGNWVIDRTPLRLSVNPNDYYDALVVTSNSSVYLTRSFGADWIDMTGDLTSASESIDHAHGWANEIIPVSGSNDLILLVGTTHGVFYSYYSNPGKWQQLSSNLPNTLISNLHYSFERDLLIAATLGRGWWTLDSPFPHIINQPTNSNSSDLSIGTIIFIGICCIAFIVLLAILYIRSQRIKRRSAAAETLLDPTIETSGFSEFSSI